MKYFKLTDKEPNHKDLVICWDGDAVMPAIYYDNSSFKGFYKFTTYYSTYKTTMYSKTKLESKHEIKNVLQWALMEKPKRK